MSIEYNQARARRAARDISATISLFASCRLRVYVITRQRATPALMIRHAAFRYFFHDADATDTLYD